MSSGVVTVKGGFYDTVVFMGTTTVTGGKFKSDVSSYVPVTHQCTALDPAETIGTVTYNYVVEPLCDHASKTHYTQTATCKDAGCLDYYKCNNASCGALFTSTDGVNFTPVEEADVLNKTVDHVYSTDVPAV